MNSSTYTRRHSPAVYTERLVDLVPNFRWPSMKRVVRRKRRVDQHTHRQCTLRCGELAFSRVFFIRRLIRAHERETFGTLLYHTPPLQRARAKWGRWYFSRHSTVADHLTSPRARVGRRRPTDEVKAELRLPKYCCLAVVKQHLVMDMVAADSPLRAASRFTQKNSLPIKTGIKVINSQGTIRLYEARSTRRRTRPRGVYR